MIPGLSNEQKYLKIDCDKYVFSFIKIGQLSVRIPWEQVSAVSCVSKRIIALLVVAISLLIPAVIELTSYYEDTSAVILYLVFSALFFFAYIHTFKSFISINASGLEYSIHTNKDHLTFLKWLESADIYRENRILYLQSIEAEQIGRSEAEQIGKSKAEQTEKSSSVAVGQPILNSVSSKSGCPKCGGPMIKGNCYLDCRK